MEKKILNYIVITSLCLVGLDILGYFFPGSLNWGFHFLGFLPSYILVLYIILAFIIFSLLYTGKLEQIFSRASEIMENKPTAVLSFSIFMFILFAFIFRIKASVLGDSFNMIYNFRDYSAGVLYLAPWHEPLSMYVLYYAVTFIGSLNYPQIFLSFFLVEIIFGLLFIVVTFYTVKHIFASPLQKFMVFVFMLVLPYMEFYFGYVEVYAVSTLLLALFTLASILVLKHKIPFYYVPIIWLLLTFSHYINGLLVFAVIYLAYLEYNERRIKNIAIGFGITFLIFIITLMIAKFDLEHLINISPVSHFLSLAGNISDLNAYSQAYTIFSIYHFIEIVNYLMMMSPLALLIIIIIGTYYKEESFINSPLNRWFAIALSPIFLYYLISKLEQGNASDWDVFAGQFYLLALFSAVIFFQREYQFSTKIFSLIVCVSLLQSLPWFAVNAPKEPSIRRFQSLWDPHILSHLGNYTHALRLFRYYDSQNDSVGQIDVWDKYSRVYPFDPRAYINELEVLNLYTPEDYSRKVNTYERWALVDPSNDSVRYALASACVNGGNRLFNDGKFEQAKIYYFKAIMADSTSSRAYNNIGSVYAQQGKIDTALLLFARAVKLDTSYAEAYYNLGNANIDVGNRKMGEEFIRRAAGLGNAQAKEFIKKKNK
jgi:hypothetical protein